MASGQTPALSGLLAAGKGPSAGGGLGGQQPQRGANQGFPAKKRKAPEGKQTARNKKNKLSGKLARSTIELKTWYCDMNSLPRGADFPSGAALRKANSKRCVIVASPKSPTRELDEEATLFKDSGMKFSVRLDSQYPTAIIMLDQHEIIFRAQNFAKRRHGGTDAGQSTATMETAAEESEQAEEVPVGGYPAQEKAVETDLGFDPIFQRTHLDAKSMDALKVTQHLDSVWQETSVSNAKFLADFGTITQAPESSGLTFLTFSLKQKTKVQVRWRGIGERKSTDAVDKLVEFLNGDNPRVTIVRKSQGLMHELDACYMHRVRVVSDKGLMPFFTDLVDATLGERFKEYIADPDKKVEHMPWMQLPSHANSPERKRYAAHMAKNCFGHLAEWETVLSVAMVHETAFENECIEKYFNWETEHRGEVIEKSGNLIKVAMNLLRRDDVAAPPIADGTRFTIRMGSEVVPENEDKEMEDAPADGADAAKEPETTPARGEPEKAKAKPRPGQTQHEASLMDYVNDKPTNKQLKVGRKAAGKDTTETEPTPSGNGAIRRSPPPSVEEVRDESFTTSQPGPSEESVPEAPKVRKGDREEQNAVEAAKNLSQFHQEEAEKFQPLPPPEPTNPAAHEAPREAEDVPMDGTAEAAGSRELQWKARAIAKETTKSYVISFTIKKTQHNLFKLGSAINLKLTMKRNALPSTRMLTAIGLLAKMAGQNNAYSNYLRAFLLGEVMPESYGEPPLVAAQKLKKEVRDIFDSYVRSLSLNGPQQAAWDSIFRTGNNINMIQGPPGTGKTALDVAIAMSFALLDMKVAMTAPTNKACEALMEKLVEVHESLCAKDPKVSDNVKILFYPTNSTLKNQLSGTDEDIEEEVEAAVIDGDEKAKKKDYSRYMLWTYVVESFQRQAQEPDANTDLKLAKKRAAQQWLDTLAYIRTGAAIDAKKLAKFHAQGSEASTAILADPAVKIVVATSNNSAQLANYGYQPEALIIDECAFGTEHDSCVPLTLKAQHIILSGDHEQLKPKSNAQYYNEYLGQIELPLFERALRNHNVPLFRLKVNYRIHPDISLLPTTVTYGWLSCDPSTEEETDVFRYVNHFWNSKEGTKYYRGHRRGCPWDKKKVGKSIRRLFFNVKGGTSAHSADSDSYVNYANARAIVDFVIRLLNHGNEMGPQRFRALRPRDITIVTGYRDQQGVIQKLLKMVMEFYGWQSMPEVVTIDSIQGGQNEIIILDITAANQWHGSNVGFIAQRNRMLVALTRAMQHIFIFGNIDCWRKELKTIVDEKKCKKFGFFVVDLVDRCDIIDVEVNTDRMPASTEELRTVPESEWSLIMPKMSLVQSKLKPKLERATKIYAASKQAEKLRYEQGLLQELTRLFKLRDDMEAKFIKDSSFEAPLFFDHEGTRKPDDAGADDTQEANEDMEITDLPEIPEAIEDENMDDIDLDTIDPKEQVGIMSDIQANRTTGATTVGDEAAALAANLSLSTSAHATRTDGGMSAAPRSPTPPERMDGPSGTPILQQRQEQGLAAAAQRDLPDRTDTSRQVLEPKPEETEEKAARKEKNRRKKDARKAARRNA